MNQNKANGSGLALQSSIWKKTVLILCGFFLMQIAVGSTSLAGESGRYQVVSGSGEDNAYLVDTSTGFVWYLTHRTMAIGREPIAIPYKFIQISPKNQPEFIIEKVPRKGGGKESGDEK